METDTPCSRANVVAEVPVRPVSALEESATAMEVTLARALRDLRVSLLHRAHWQHKRWRSDPLNVPVTINLSASYETRLHRQTV